MELIVYSFAGYFSTSAKSSGMSHSINHSEYVTKRFSGCKVNNWQPSKSSNIIVFAVGIPYNTEDIYVKTIFIVFSNNEIDKPVCAALKCSIVKILK